MNNYTSTPFNYVNGSFVLVPVTINDSIQTNFVFDTGMGLNLISESLCKDLKCPSAGAHRGKRMSGQEIVIPLSTVSALSFANVRLIDIPVGVFDMEKIMPGQHIGGFLSLGFFRGTAFTMDYQKHAILIENDETLKKRRAEGLSVPVQLKDDGDGAICIFLPITLPTGDTISVEVDTGSQALILNERFMGALNISTSGSDTQRVESKDETGHEFVRYFSTLSGRVHVARNPTIGVESPEAMFQNIIYDGLIGHYFLSQFIVTYNLPESEMIFQEPSE